MARLKRIKLRTNTWLKDIQIIQNNVHILTTCYKHSGSELTEMISILLVDSKTNEVIELMKWESDGGYEFEFIEQK